jgi:hypothetical protein
MIGAPHATMTRMTQEPAPQAPSKPQAAAPDAPEPGPLGRVGELLEGAVGAVVDGASSVVGGVVDVAQGAARRWDERPASRVRQVRRRARRPLPYLYAVHPEARKASPRELGLKTIDVDDIAGTAVGGAVQRGGDFLPLKPFRSLNWNARWQRLRLAADRLAILPPIDVLLYAGKYWVLDGHNRVALALYAGQVGIDANVIELVPPGARPSQQASSLAPVLEGSLALRTAGEGHRPGSFDEDHVHERREDDA